MTKNCNTAINFKLLTLINSLHICKISVLRSTSCKYMRNLWYNIYTYEKALDKYKIEATTLKYNNRFGLIWFAKPLFRQQQVVFYDTHYIGGFYIDFSQLINVLWQILRGYFLGQLLPCWLAIAFVANFKLKSNRKKKIDRKTIFTHKCVSNEAARNAS